MRYSDLQIVFQEIPNEISLAIHVTGCPLKCFGCHSSIYWNPDVGQDLTIDHLCELLDRYQKYITCVLFLGGEWDADYLLKLLKTVSDKSLKTALYTGLDIKDISSALMTNLNYLKYGPYKANLGGLSSPTTNQNIINVKSGENLNSYFIKEENNYDSSQSRTS